MNISNQIALSVSQGSEKSVSNTSGKDKWELTDLLKEKITEAEI